jgi:16S rRNA (cytosine1402-N4)-methyltransferase
MILPPWAIWFYKEAFVDEENAHVPVLLEAVLAALAPAPGARCVDVTGGRGGHGAALLARLGTAGRLLILDRDPEAVAFLAQRFGNDERVTVRRAAFSHLAEVLAGEAWPGVDAILADLGVSSPQLDEGQRGFSFLRDGPLDMRMDPEAGMSAAAWLAVADEREISAVLRDYGEERFARPIARAICRRRAAAPITRTGDLAEIIAAVLPRREPGQHPATRSFQGIRIYVNEELTELERFLPQAMAALRPGGRLAVISFHSLEDRIVKRFMRADAFRPAPGLPLREDQLPPLPWRPVGKAQRAGEEETRRNPRARSAVLRVAEKS